MGMVRRTGGKGRRNLNVDIRCQIADVGAPAQTRVCLRFLLSLCLSLPVLKVGWQEGRLASRGCQSRDVWGEFACCWSAPFPP